MTLERTSRPRTAEAIASLELREAIVRGDLAAGTQIRQETTAQQLGVSLIPLREALKTLAGEGIVTYRPQRGYFVTELRGDASSGIYLARDLLETKTERLAIAQLTDADFARMREQLHDQERAVETRDAVEMIASNRRFHFVIFDRCSNPWLQRFVTQLWDTLDPYRVLSYRRMWLQDPERHIPAEILAEHEQILAALQLRNEQRSLSLLVKHRSRSETFLNALLDPGDRGRVVGSAGGAMHRGAGAGPTGSGSPSTDPAASPATP